MEKLGSMRKYVSYTLLFYFHCFLFIDIITKCIANVLSVNSDREVPVYIHKRRKTNKKNSYT